MNHDDSRNVANSEPPSQTNPNTDATTCAERRARGLDLLNRVHPDAWPRVQSSVADVAPDFADFIAQFAFGDIYARPGLDMRTRQLLTVAGLTVLGHAHDELRAHIVGARNIGWSRTEISEAIMQMAVYAGFPAALHGLKIAAEIFAAEDLAAQNAEGKTT